MYQTLDYTENLANRRPVPVPHPEERWLRVLADDQKNVHRPTMKQISLHRLFELMTVIAICFALSPNVEIAVTLSLMAFSLFFQAGFVATLCCCIGMVVAGDGFFTYLPLAFLVSIWAMVSARLQPKPSQQD